MVVLNKLGFNPIIVHGGGKRINSKLSEVNIKSNFINGLRVTDKDTINIVENVLIEFNKEIVEALNELACKAKRITIKRKQYNYCRTRKQRPWNLWEQPTRN